MNETGSLRVPDEDELVAILAAAIRQGGGGRMSRVADAFLAAVDNGRWGSWKAAT